MVSQNFAQLDSAYSRLLSNSDSGGGGGSDEDQEYLNLEELKPHHLTELGIQQTTPHSHDLASSAAVDHQMGKLPSASHHHGDGSSKSVGLSVGNINHCCGGSGAAVGGSGISNKIYYDLNNVKPSTNNEYAR